MKKQVMTFQNLLSKAVSPKPVLHARFDSCFAQQDTVVIEKNKFEEAIVLIAQGQNASRMLDSVKSWYGELLQNYDQSQRNLKACMDERDIAHKYIDTLRTNLSRAWTAKDEAVAKAAAEHNKKVKAFGIGPEIGYNPVTQKMYGGIGIHLSIVRFALFKQNNDAVQ
jgi:hypothetical protein